MSNYLFYYIAISSSIIPLFIIGIKPRNNRKHNRFRSIFYLYLLSRFITDIGSIILEMVLYNSLPIFHFSILIQFLLILELFYYVQNNFIPKQFFQFLAIICFSLDLTLTSNILQNNHLNTMYSYVILSGFSSLYLLNIKGNFFQRFLLSSISVYTIAFSFLLFFEDLILKSKELNNYLLNFMALLSLVLNILFSYALCLKPKN